MAIKEVLLWPGNNLCFMGARVGQANTPFRFWKAKSYEGGICTPMIAHWPVKGIKKNVGKRLPKWTCDGHHATCIDMAGATYPTKYKMTSFH